MLIAASPLCADVATASSDIIVEAFIDGSILVAYLGLGVPSLGLDFPIFAVYLSHDLCTYEIDWPFKLLSKLEPGNVDLLI